ncbi:MAG: hypothetical protein ACI8ZT_002614, partial [Bacteroidia bacterium]
AMVRLTGADRSNKLFINGSGEGNDKSRIDQMHKQELMVIANWAYTVGGNWSIRSQVDNDIKIKVVVPLSLSSTSQKVQQSQTGNTTHVRE